MKQADALVWLRRGSDGFQKSRGRKKESERAASVAEAAAAAAIERG